MTDQDRGHLRALRAPAFVGREEALRSLDAAYARALRFATPQTATVVAPMGLGKSRLLAAWASRLTTGHECLVLRVSAEARGEDTEVFSLVADLLRARFGITTQTPADEVAAAVRHVLQTVFGDRRVAEVAALLGRFVGLELPESPLGQALSTRPEQETDLACSVLCRFLEEDARKRPVILLIDDVHLADDRSLDVLDRLSTEAAGAPLVMVATARAELFVRRPNWGRSEGSHARIELSPLSPLEMDIFIRSALDSDAVAPGLADRAAAESGGNPQLLERLLRAYREEGILVPLGSLHKTWAFDHARAAAQPLPLDAEARAVARLAALRPAERDLLVRGAACGSSFYTGAVIALGRLGAEPTDPAAVFAPDPTIEQARALLADLRERDFVVELPVSSVPGEAEWSFCHDVERDLLLQSADLSLLRRRRKAAAQWLLGRMGPRPTSERSERLGVLFEDAGEPERAAVFFMAAGDEARRRLRHERARGLYLRAIRLADSEDAMLKLDAHHKLGDVAARLGRARESLAHFTEMLRLAWRLDLPAKGGAAHARLGRLHRALGDYKAAIKHLDLAHLLFDLAGDRAGIAATLDDIGRVHLLRGNFEEALTFHRAALPLREAIGDGRGISLTLSWLGLALLNVGDLATAQLHFRKSLVLSRAARDGHGIVFALLDLGRLEREAGRSDRAIPLLEEARTLAREMGERLYECNLGLQIGESLLQQGRAADAEHEFHAASEIAQRFGAKRLVAEAGRGLAETRLALGDSVAARDHAYVALGLAESMGASPLAGASLRVLATAIASGAPGDADRGGPRELFDRAVELLATTGAELELGRTLQAYAEFEERTGRSDAAFDLRVQAQSIWQKARRDAAAPDDAVTS